jgi:hypothetical protein
VISPESDQDHIFIRVNDQLAQANLHKAAEAAAEGRVVRANHTDEKTGITRSLDHRRQAHRRRINAKLAGSSGRAARDRDQEQRQADAGRSGDAGQRVRLLALDLMPDNHLGKMMAHRRGVPGYDPDMLRSYNQRAKVGVDALAGMAVQRKLTESYTNMREAEKQARRTPSSKMSIAQRNGMTEVIDELSKHDKEFSLQPRGGHVRDQLKAMSGAFFLSANLAYPAVNLVQVPMLALPRLGARATATSKRRRQWRARDS